MANIGPTEAKYLLKALAIPLASVKVLPSTVNQFGKDNLLRLELISCLIPFHVTFARVTPLFKHGERSDIDNYRPISVISIIGKVFERIIYYQLFAY